MLIRFTRKALGFPSQQKLTYSFVASRKRTATVVKPAAPVAIPNDALQMAQTMQSIMMAQNMLNAQNSLASFAPNLAAFNNAANLTAQVQVPEVKKIVAKKPAIKVGGRVKTRALSVKDLHPYEEKDTSGQPKPPQNTYFIFKQEVRKQMKAENQKVPNSDVQAKIKELWAKKDQATIDRLNSILNQQRQRYNQEKIAYQSQHGKVTKRPMKKNILYRKIKVTKNPDNPQPPKEIRNSYLLYSKVHRPQVAKQYPNAGSAQIMSILSANWKKSDEATKKIYKDLLVEQKKQYKIQKEEYEKLYGKINRSGVVYQAVDISGNLIAQKVQKVVAKAEAITGFDVYSSQKIAELKAIKSPLSAKDQKGLIKLQWKGLSKEDQEKYQALAKQENVKTASAAKTTPPPVADATITTTPAPAPATATTTTTTPPAPAPATTPAASTTTTASTPKA